MQSRFKGILNLKKILNTDIFMKQTFLTALTHWQRYLEEPKKSHYVAFSGQFFSVKLENGCAEYIIISVAVSLLLYFFYHFVLSVFVQACQLLLQQQQQQPQQQQQQLLQNQRKFVPNVRQQADPQQVQTVNISLTLYLSASSSQLLTLGFLSSQLARIMAVLQQQRQQQVGGLSGSSKLSPSHHGGGIGGGPRLPGADPLPHPGLAGSVADLHQKTLGPLPGEQLFLYWLY